MLLLAIDTSSTSGSIALVKDGSLVTEWTAGDVGTHSEWLMGSVDGLLESTGVSIRDVDLFAMGRGPGSFTGLRIGVSIVKGLAWSIGKPVIGVSTLKALAMNAPYGGAVCPVLDARKKEVYAALYRTTKEGVFETLLEDSAVRPEDLIKKIEAIGLREAVLFLGGGLGVYGNLVKEGLKDSILAPEPLWHVRASNIALLALENLKERTSPLELKPVYLRKSEAELKEKEALRKS